MIDVAIDNGSLPLRCLIAVGSLGRGGGERQSLLTACSLREAGADVRVFVAAGSDALRRDGLGSGLEIDGPLKGESQSAQLTRLKRAVEALRPHVVVTFLDGATHRFALIRPLSIVARRARWIVAMRGNLRGRDFLRRPLSTAIRLLCWRMADRIVVNAGTLAANVIAVRSDVASKIAVIPNVATSGESDRAAARGRLAELGVPREALVIGAIGSFQDERNYPLLARALPAVRQRFPAVHLVVVGRTTGPECEPSATHFRSLVDSLGLTDCVSTLGELPGARSLLAGFDVFALPSKLEGSSNGLLEALLAGAAIATTPVADAESLTAGAAEVSRGWTPAALSDALIRAIEGQDKLRLDALARGRILLAERSPARIGQQWLSLVAELAASART